MLSFVVPTNKLHNPCPLFREDKAFKLIKVFISCDDFCNALTHWQTYQGQPVSGRCGQLTDSEMLAITIFYHYSGAKCFEYYWV